MFRIKICGITSVEDALAAVDAGADAIGLNFYEKSPRCINAELARQISLSVEDSVQRVGVFVNADAEFILRHVDFAQLGFAQLHGDEPPEFIKALKDCPVLRARRMDDCGVAALAEDLAVCKTVGRLPEAVLVDAAAPGHYGGTGQTVAWSELVSSQDWLAGRPLILAGGLRPENVAEAIRTARPHGVDTASGVESSPGVKDVEKMRSFVAAAKAAFEEIAC